MDDTRYVYQSNPRASITALPVVNGGTGLKTVTEVKAVLGLVDVQQLNQPNGIPTLEADGRIAIESLPIALRDAIQNSSANSELSFNYLRTVYNGGEFLIIVNNFDSGMPIDLTFTINGVSQPTSSTYGDLWENTYAEFGNFDTVHNTQHPHIRGRIGDQRGEAIITLNGQSITFTIADTVFTKPVIESVTPGDGGVGAILNVSSYGTIGSSSIILYGVDWQFASDVDFTTIVKQQEILTYGDYRELGVGAPGATQLDFIPAGNYYVRARYFGGIALDGGYQVTYGVYSDVINFDLVL